MALREFPAILNFRPSDLLSTCDFSVLEDGNQMLRWEEQVFPPKTKHVPSITHWVKIFMSKFDLKHCSLNFGPPRERVWVHLSLMVSFGPTANIYFIVKMQNGKKWKPWVASETLLILIQIVFRFTPFTPTYNLEWPRNQVFTCLWIVGGSWSTQRKHSYTGRTCKLCTERPCPSQVSNPGLSWFVFDYMFW